MTLQPPWIFLAAILAYLAARTLSTTLQGGLRWLAAHLLKVPGPMFLYLGSLGEAKHALHLRIGRTSIAISPAVLLLRGHLLDHTHPVASTTTGLLALAGPAACSLLFLLASFAWYIVTFTGAHIPFTPYFILCALLLITAVDLGYALLGKRAPILSPREQVILSDAETLQAWMRYGTSLDAYLHARYCFEADLYSTCSAVITTLAEDRKLEKLLLEYLIYALIADKQAALALHYHATMTDTYPADPYDDCLRAMALFMLDHRDEARKAMEDAVIKAPGMPEARIMLAWEAILTKDWKLALEHATVALDSDKDHAPAFHCKAWAHHGLDQDEAATNFAHKALASEHENPFLHLLLARIAERTGDQGKASEHFATAQLLGHR